MKKLIPVIIIAAVLVYFFFPSGDDPSEIEAVVKKTIAAGKKKDLDGVMDSFSRRYKDEYGMNYVVVKKIMKNVFSKYDSFDGDFFDLTASIGKSEDGEKQAVANFNIYISGSKSEIPVAILGTANSPENITVTFRKSKLGGWKIVSVEGVEFEEGF